MLRKVKLYGELADFVGHKELEAVINSTGEAIRFLITNFPKLEAHMSQRYYKILVDDWEIGEEDIQSPIGQSDISIVPVIAGAGGLGKSLLGIALIGIAFMLPVSVPLAPLKFGGLAGFVGANSMLANIGLGLTLIGVSEMLFPLPKPQEFNNEEDPRISFSFSGVQNTSRAGTSHPICYGEITTGSVVISATVDTNQVSA